MRLLIELNAGLFFASCAILYFRVHVHLEYTPRSPRSIRKHRRLNRQPSPAPAPTHAAWAAPAQTVRDLESALLNLGATKNEARQRAQAAIAKGGPADFDALILRAMQN
jgi:hypothetical protein